MPGEQQLSRSFLERHPEDAARVLERFPPASVAALLENVPAEIAAPVLRRMSQAEGGRCLRAVSAIGAAAILSHLPPDIASALLLRLAPDTREEVLAHVPGNVAAPLEAMLRYPEGSVGSLMDPQAYVATADATVAETLERIQTTGRDVLYYLYVVDREHRLAGVLNLRDLLLADPEESVSSVMRREVTFVYATDTRGEAAAKRGGYLALPVVERDGRFVGVVRDEALRPPELPGRAARPARGVGTFLLFAETYWKGLFSLIAAPFTRSARVRRSLHGPMDHPEKP